MSRDQNQQTERDAPIRKPGTETKHFHIAGMFAQQGHADIAHSLCLKLLPHLRERVENPWRNK